MKPMAEEQSRAQDGFFPRCRRCRWVRFHVTAQVETLAHRPLSTEYLAGVSGSFSLQRRTVLFVPKQNDDFSSFAPFPEPSSGCGEAPQQEPLPKDPRHLGVPRGGSADPAQPRQLPGTRGAGGPPAAGRLSLPALSPRRAGARAALPPKRSQRASRRAVPSGGESAGKGRGAIGAASGPPDLERAAAAGIAAASPPSAYGVERSAPQESRGESPHSAGAGGEENTRGVAPAFPERRSCRPAALRSGSAFLAGGGNPSSRPAPSRTAPRSPPSRCCPLPVPRGPNPPRAGAVRRGRGRGALEGRRQRLRDPRRLPLALRRRRRRRPGGDADAAGQQRQQHHVGSGRRRRRPRRGQRPPGPGESLLQGVSAGAEGREGA